ncbi:SRPBCC family protein [Ulvibacter antarcticus]|uniref:Polyketide cyclase/dehydrase/lipid transport protein n=1 Tax=Ulvibacter antarcticus TaxID=442714 RepID=A0A3L9YJE1_9FLAO|nr:SRPBCC family protein [Ulvibacter antarcticus]RMA58048.1 hypothetical protein BXY75_2856 [Ulvibacter antarcticus]
MKYTSEIQINLSREKVIEKLDNAKNMKHWQKGLIGYEFLSDDPKAVGAKMNLSYKMGKREIEMTETIIKNDFPKEFHAVYDAKGVHNIQKNYFSEVDANTTKWVSENEFQFGGLMMKVMGFLMPGAFKKQSMKYLIDFKNFAEKGISVAE